MQDITGNDSGIYTVGYEGRKIGDFLATLLALRISVLVDVRDSASSRKLGFSSAMLKRLSEKVGIEYRHFPSLGVPSERRDAFRRLDTVPEARRWYRDRCSENPDDALPALVELCRDGHTALLCYERDVRYCHRQPLAQILSEMTDLEVHHL